MRAGSGCALGLAEQRLRVLVAGPIGLFEGLAKAGEGGLARSAWPSACWAMARKARSAARLPGAAVVFCWSARKRVSTASPYLPARY